MKHACWLLKNTWKISCLHECSGFNSATTRSLVCALVPTLSSEYEDAVTTCAHQTQSGNRGVLQQPVLSGLSKCYDHSPPLLVPKMWLYPSSPLCANRLCGVCNGGVCQHLHFGDNLSCSPPLHDNPPRGNLSFLWHFGAPRH